MKKFLILIIQSLTIFILFICIIYLACFISGAPPLANDYITVLYDEQGNIIEHTDISNKEVQLENISPALINATLIIEDQHFYNHKGFDFKRIVSALIKNIQSSRLKEGASTITQQYARNLYLTHERTWKRKIIEAIYTIRLEMFYSKEDILNGYLNAIYYGHGAYGIEAASKMYFNKEAQQLTLAEATMLAGIPKGPTYYSPYNNEIKALGRQQHILNLLLKEKVISNAQYNTAKEEKLHLQQTDIKKDSFASYYEDTVFKEAQSVLNIDKEAIETGGYKIYTTLNEDYQNILEKTIADQVDSISEIQIAALTIQPQTGAIRALVGGRSYEKSPFNRALDAKRMVGSTFKPFLYYAALENGYTPSTMLLSKPTTFTVDNGVYRPKNYNGYYAHKPITLAQAIALSDNIYAVKTNMFLNTENVIQTTRKFGIKAYLPNVPSLALGSASISLNEMVSAYGVIANGGREINSYTIEKIVNRQGQTLFEKDNNIGKQRLDSAKAFVLTQLMTGMFDTKLDGHMQVTGTPIIDKVNHTYAGKTGTTDSDNWMIGFSPTLVTGVWTGYDNNKSIEKSIEKTYARNVWIDFMEMSHSQRKNGAFPVPEGVAPINIDPTTGFIATSSCPTNRVVYFEKGTEPLQYCDAHIPTDLAPSEDGEKKEDSMLRKLFKLFLKY